MKQDEIIKVCREHHRLRAEPWDLMDYKAKEADRDWHGENVRAHPGFPGMSEDPVALYRMSNLSGRGCSV
jgi:hypothetical protein